MRAQINLEIVHGYFTNLKNIYLLKRMVKLENKMHAWRTIFF